MSATAGGRGVARVLMVLVLAAAVTSGCTLTRTRQGRPLDPLAASRVQAGDTKPQVLERLGPPDAMGLVRGGSHFVYFFRKQNTDELSVSAFQASASWSSSDKRLDRLIVRFDREGLVTEVSRPLGLR